MADPSLDELVALVDVPAAMEPSLEDLVAALEPPPSAGAPPSRRVLMPTRRVGEDVAELARPEPPRPQVPSRHEISRVEPGGLAPGLAPPPTELPPPRIGARLRTALGPAPSRVPESAELLALQARPETDVPPTAEAEEAARMELLRQRSVLAPPTTLEQIGRAAITGLRTTAAGTAAQLAEKKLLGIEPEPIFPIGDTLLETAIFTLTSIVPDLPIFLAGGVIGGIPLRTYLKSAMQGMVQKGLQAGLTRHEAQVVASEGLRRSASARVLEGIGTGAGAFALEDFTKSAVQTALTDDTPNLLAAVTAGGAGAVIGGATLGAGRFVPPGVLRLLVESGTLGATSPLVQEGRTPTVDDLLRAGVALGTLAVAFRLAELPSAVTAPKGLPRAEAVPSSREAISAFRAQRAREREGIPPPEPTVSAEGAEIERSPEPVSAPATPEAPVSGEAMVRDRLREIARERQAARSPEQLALDALADALRARTEQRERIEILEEREARQRLAERRPTTPLETPTPRVAPASLVEAIRDGVEQAVSRVLAERPDLLAELESRGRPSLPTAEDVALARAGIERRPRLTPEEQAVEEAQRFPTVPGRIFRTEVELEPQPTREAATEVPVAPPEVRAEPALPREAIPEAPEAVRPVPPLAPPIAAPPPEPPAPRPTRTRLISTAGGREMLAITEFSLDDPQAWARIVRGRGGLRPTDAYRGELADVPFWLKNRRGLPADELADEVARERGADPIEVERKMFRALARVRTAQAEARVLRGTEAGQDAPPADLQNVIPVEEWQAMSPRQRIAAVQFLRSEAELGDLPPALREPAARYEGARQRPVAPATFAGFQERRGAPPLALFTLTEDIPGHPKGSTVSDTTLQQAGFSLPEIPPPPPPRQRAPVPQREIEGRSGADVRLENRAIEIFGTTENPFSIGYVLRDGRGLDFELGRGARADHSEISAAFFDAQERRVAPRSEKLPAKIDFLRHTGAVRAFLARDGLLAIDIPGTVSTRQRQTLAQMARAANGVEIDIIDPTSGEVRRSERFSLPAERGQFFDLLQTFEGLGPTLREGRPLDITPAMRQSERREGGEQLEFSFRPGSPPDSRARTERAIRAIETLAPGDVSSARGALGLPVRRPRGPQTLGVAITQQLRRIGRIDFRGQDASDALAVAQLSQPLRNPQFEVFTAFYTRGDRVAGHESHSARLANAVGTFVEPTNAEIERHRQATGLSRGNALDDLRKKAIARFIHEIRGRMARLKADGVWFSHNHPSGDVKPSRDDVLLTEGLARAGLPVRGHVVVDSGEYALIAPGGRTSTHRLPGPPPETLLVPSQPHPLLGERAVGTGEVASMAASLDVPARTTVLFHLDARLRVRAVQVTPTEWFARGRGLEAYLLGQRRAAGAARTVGVAEALDPPTERAVGALIRRGALYDFVTMPGTTIESRFTGARETPVPVGVRFREEGPAGVDFEVQSRGGARLFSETGAEGFAEELRREGYETEIRPAPGTKFLRQVWARLMQPDVQPERREAAPRVEPPPPTPEAPPGPPTARTEAISAPPRTPEPAQEHRAAPVADPTLLEAPAPTPPPPEIRQPVQAAQRPLDETIPPAVARIAKRAAALAGKIRSEADRLGTLNEEARHVRPEAETIAETGTLSPEARRPFRELGAKPETEAFRVSERDIADTQATLVALTRDYQQFRSEVEQGADPFSIHTATAVQRLLSDVTARLNVTAKEFRKQRFAAGRAVKQFGRRVPQDVLDGLQAAGIMTDWLQRARPRLSIYTNLLGSLRRFTTLSESERQQFVRDLVDAWRLNLFSTTSWTLDFVGNVSEIGMQVAGGVGFDLVHAVKGHPTLPSLQGFFRALRDRAMHLGEPLAETVEAGLGTTIGGERVQGGFRGALTGRTPGTFTTRAGVPSRAVDLVAATPLYLKGATDTGSKRLMAQATLWREAIVAADRRGLTGQQERRVFFRDFMDHLPPEAAQRAIEEGQKAGFNRALTAFEERVSQNLWVRLFGDVFARWPFQFTRAMGEWLGYNGPLFDRLRAGQASAEEVGGWLAKSAAGWFALWLLHETLWDRVDFNSMEYVHPNGDRTRLSNRDPLPTALWLLATIKGDVEKSTGALRYASVPGARLLSGEGGLLGGLVSAFTKASANADVDSRAVVRLVTDTVNRLLPGQAVLSAVDSIFDPTVREGIGANIPGVSSFLPAVIKSTTGEALQPRQVIPGVEVELPTVGGTPIPGARRVLDPVERLLFRYGVVVYRGPRTPIAGHHPTDVPTEVRREWMVEFGRERQRFLGRLSQRLEAGTLEGENPDHVREEIVRQDALAAQIATNRINARYGTSRKLPRRPTIRERRAPELFQR